MRELEFSVRGAHIALDALLKATGLAGSGGQAKTLIAAGEVQVDGCIERRKTFKIRPGQVVRFGDARVRVVAHPANDAPGAVPG